ncbi:ATP-grasp domain-containing protein [Zobellia nedashkovskayae]|uniref:ATP-grasp domain-containing protein n=1 Tax=Zobellia nedashkovskayae TaxID=2779510 RepID=UPI00188D7FDA|nr:ATP-grasp domain-containing protein [Zobellia nedashkovskayae]
MNILFTCAGRRNYLIDYFKKEIGGNGKIIVVDSDYTAPALAAGDVAIKMPSLYHPDYLSVLNNVIRDYNVDLVIPLNDLELLLMSENKELLEAHRAKVVVSEANIISFCADKWQTYNFFKDLSIKTPLSFLKIEDVVEALSKKILSYPIILKPRWGSGSIGIEEVRSEEELYYAYKLLLIKIKRSVIANMHDDDFVDTIIFQEKIVGQEYGVDILNDFNGNYYSAFVRKKLAMRAGETDKAITVIDNKFLEIAQKLGESTKHIGIMDCDFFVVDNEIYFLEMNPRFGGGYPFSHEAGVNIPAIYLAWLRGDLDISKYIDYRPGCIFSKYDRIIKVVEQEKLNSYPPA